MRRVRFGLTRTSDSAGRVRVCLRCRVFARVSGDILACHFSFSVSHSKVRGERGRCGLGEEHEDLVRVRVRAGARISGFGFGFGFGLGLGLGFRVRVRGRRVCIYHAAHARAPHGDGLEYLEAARQQLDESEAHLVRVRVGVRLGFGFGLGLG